MEARMFKYFVQAANLTVAAGSQFLVFAILANG